MALNRFFGLSPELPRELRSNIIHYYFDISWWGLYGGATAAFLTIYATRLRATPAQIGLLSALPAGITLLLSLPFANLVLRMGAHRATWIGAFFARFPFLFYALLPFFFQEAGQVRSILVIAVLMTIPNTLIGIAFSHLMMEAIPPHWRGMVVGVRNALFSSISFLVTVISGQILTRLAFPVGYQVLFVIGFIGGVATTYHLYKIRPLGNSPARTLAAASQPVRQFPSYLPRIDAPGRRYMRVLGILFLFNATNNMVGPLVPGLLVNKLRLSDAWISTGTAASSLIVFSISLFIAHLTRRTGNRGGTAIGSLLIAAQAVVLALARTPGDYLLSVAIGGIGSGILSTAQYNYHLDNVPENDRPVWLSWSLMLGNTALLIGSLGGPLLATRTGTPLALIVFGAFRLLMGLVILRWG